MAEKEPDRKNNRLKIAATGLALGSVIGGGALLQQCNRHEAAIVRPKAADDDDQARDDSPLAKPGTPLQPKAPDKNTQTHTARVAAQTASPKVEVSDLGILLDLKAEDFMHYRFNIKDTGKGYAVEAIPIYIPRENTTEDYLVEHHDPLNGMGANASATSARNALNDYKKLLREAEQERGYYDKTMPVTCPSDPKDIPPGKPVTLAETHSKTGEGSKLILRIDLGKEGCPNQRWLEQLANWPAQLHAQLTAALKPADPCTSFLSANTKDKIEIGSCAKAISRAFMLNDEERAELGAAIKKGDFKKATYILRYLTAEVQLSTGLFHAVQSYNKALAELTDNLSWDDVSVALYRDGSQLTPYEDIAAAFADDTPLAAAVRLLPEYISRPHYEEFSRLPAVLKNRLQRFLYDPDTADLPYESFIDNLGASTILDRVAYDPSEETLRTLAHYADQLFGPDNRSGWLGEPDPSRNILSRLQLIHGLDEVSHIRNMQAEQGPGILQVKNGRAYLIMEIPVYRESGLSRTLLDSRIYLDNLCEAMRIMQSGIPFAGQELLGNPHSPASLAQQIEAFTISKQAPTSAQSLLRNLTFVWTLSPDLQNFLSSPDLHETDSVQLANKKNVDGLKVAKIQKIKRVPVTGHEPSSTQAAMQR